MLQDSSNSFLSGLDTTSSLPTQQQYILEQAASTHVRLTVPLSKLLDLGRPDNQRYILEQAAYALNVPLPLLLESSRRHHPPFKRQRLNSDIPMSSPFSSSPAAQDVQEKPPLSGHPSQADDGDSTRRQFPALDGIPAGWTGSRLANCFASFAMCPPCSPYEAQTSKSLYLQTPCREALLGTLRP